MNNKCPVSLSFPSRIWTQNCQWIGGCIVIWVSFRIHWARTNSSRVQWRFFWSMGPEAFRKPFEMKVFQGRCTSSPDCSLVVIRCILPFLENSGRMAGIHNTSQNSLELAPNQFLIHFLRRRPNTVL
jgi:hypothetical protein